MALWHSVQSTLLDAGWPTLLASAKRKRSRRDQRTQRSQHVSLYHIVQLEDDKTRTTDLCVELHISSVLLLQHPSLQNIRFLRVSNARFRNAQYSTDTASPFSSMRASSVLTGPSPTPVRMTLLTPSFNRPTATSASALAFSAAS